MQVINVNVLWNYTHFLAGKDVSGGYIPPDRFNEMLPILVNKIVRKYYGLPEEYMPGSPQPKITYEESQLVTDYISQLKVEKLYVGISNSGKIVRPADNYLHASSMAVCEYVVSKVESETKESDKECGCQYTVKGKKASKNGTTIAVNWRPITFVPEKERWGWLDSSLRKPTMENPIACFLGDDIIQIYPESVKSALFTYVRYPKASKWGYTVQPGVGVPVYDAASSVHIELPYMCADELAVTILDRIGIVIREPGLVDWSRYIKNTGK